MNAPTTGGRCQLLTLLSPEQTLSQRYLQPFHTRNVPRFKFNVEYPLSYRQPYYKIPSCKYSVYIIYVFRLLYMRNQNLIAQKIPEMYKS
jgi:hypothetical protein